LCELDFETVGLGEGFVSEWLGLCEDGFTVGLCAVGDGTAVGDTLAGGGLAKDGDTEDEPKALTAVWLCGGSALSPRQAAIVPMINNTAAKQPPTINAALREPAARGAA
jgi:hypothetical protein